MTGFFQFILDIDRRWVFVGVAIVVIVPFFIPMGLDVGLTKETQQVFDEVDALAGTGMPLMLAMDYDPGTMAELQPMANAVLDHCFSRNIPVIGMTFQPTGVGLAEEALREAAKRFAERSGSEKVYGVDYVFMGYKPFASVVIIQMGQDFSEAHETDHKGVLKSDLPIVANVTNYDDIGLCMDLAGSALPRTWINYAVGRFNARFTMGVTGVMAADFYPYIQTGQSKGIIGGMKGAAEYERLNLENGHADGLALASRGMDSQSVTHIFIILLIVLGNAAFFATRGLKRN
jgi:hypothetical protein